MIEKELLDLLVCPENQSPLHTADDQLLARLNQAIAAGGVKNRSGRPVEEPVVGGLVREDETLLYPVIDDIPVLLLDESIVLTGDF